MDTIRIKLEGLGSQFKSIYLRNKLLLMIGLIQLVGIYISTNFGYIGDLPFFPRLSNRLEK
jgi:hypothetical protein